MKLCRVYYDLQSLYFCVVWGLPLKTGSVDTPCQNWLRHIRKYTSPIFWYFAHVIVDHNPVEKNMIYRSLLRADIKGHGHPSPTLVVFCYHMGKKYQRIGDVFYFICLNQFLTSVYGIFLWKLEVWNVWEMMAVDFIAFWDSHIIYGSGISKWVGLTWLVLMSVGLWSFKKLFTSCKFCPFYKTILVSTKIITRLFVLGVNEETKSI